jgi:hypothetical protein
MATKSKLKSKSSLSKTHKDSLLNEINSYASALAKAAKWASSDESVAYVKSRDDDKTGVNYIYEFYCYIRIACDLKANYKCKYVEGTGLNKHKFPQASSVKKGKPKFIFYGIANPTQEEFQYCSGVKIKGKYDIEKDHPDISFQLPNTGDEPGTKDLILILDAKFQLDPKTNLDKGEIDKFETIVRRLKLNSDSRKRKINFNSFKELEGNCLLTNALFHHKECDELEFRLKEEFIKEVQEFYPKKRYKVVPK